MPAGTEGARHTFDGAISGLVSGWYGSCAVLGSTLDCEEEGTRRVFTPPGAPRQAVNDWAKLSVLDKAGKVHIDRSGDGAWDTLPELAGAQSLFCEAVYFGVRTCGLFADGRIVCAEPPVAD